MLVRLFLPIILKSFVDKISRDFSGMNNQQAQHQPPEGEIRIDNNQSKQKTTTSDEGEYVDFEEIDKGKSDL